MENHLEEFHCQKDDLSRFRAGKFTKKVSDALKELLALDKLGVRVSDPAWNNLSAVVKLDLIDEDTIRI